ncbi:hypothetical protein, partial [Salmonella enterica]|uniref:hypothetical protein n=1 Tax=Salmonella enterica TaxID=28901 RepID=UPI001C9A1627
NPGQTVHFRMPRVLMMMAEKFSFFTTWGLILSEVVRTLHDYGFLRLLVIKFKGPQCCRFYYTLTF